MIAGMPSIAASSSRRDAKASLPTARHTDTDGVRDEIFRVVEQQTVVRFAEIKNTELLKVHSFKFLSFLTADDADEIRIVIRVIRGSILFACTRS